jgi:hypothetical protein
MCIEARSQAYRNARYRSVVWQARTICLHFVICLHVPSMCFAGTLLTPSLGKGLN